MLTKLYKAIQETQRPSNIVVDDVSYIFNGNGYDPAVSSSFNETFDSKKIRDLSPAKQFTYRSIESFIHQIEHFVAYHEQYDNYVESNIHIVLTSQGGVFYPDFSDQKDCYKYERQIEPVFQQLRGLKSGREYNQKGLLSFLLENRNYIQDFPKVFNGFKKIKNTKTVKFDTEPIISDNGSEEFSVVQSYEFDGQIKKEELTLIPEIHLKLPVIANNTNTYDFSIYITPMRGTEGQISFEIYAPGIEYLYQQALKDEYEYLQIQISSLQHAYVGLSA